MDARITVYDPTAQEHSAQIPPNRIDGLSGKVLGFIDNAKPNFEYLVDDLADIFITKYGVASVVKRRKASAGLAAPAAIMKDIVDQCDAVVTGSGD